MVGGGGNHVNGVGVWVTQWVTGPAREQSKRGVTARNLIRQTTKSRRGDMKGGGRECSLNSDWQTGCLIVLRMSDMLACWWM